MNPTDSGATSLRGIDVIKDNLKRLPSKPGVYRMFGEHDDVLYVGKARDLKARVSNYARLGGHTQRIARMISTDGIMRLAYWTSTNDRILQTGVVREENGEFSWDAGESTFTDFGITSCAYTSDTLVASPRATSAASLARGDFDALLSIEDGAGLQVSTDFGMTNTEISVRDGITVTAPDAPDAMAAMGTMMTGGYPGGVIVLAGETGPNQHQAVFVDPSLLTLEDDQ